MPLGISRTYNGGAWQHNLPATPSTASPGTVLTSGGSANTLGSYATLIASTTYDVYGFWLLLSNSVASAALSDMLMDIAIGASQQNVIVPQLQVGWALNVASGGGRLCWIPIFIPKGVAISARIQALIASDTVSAGVWLNSGNSGLPGPLFAGCDAYGVVGASSGGTSHTPGNSGAESTAANIGSVTSKHYGAVMLSVNGTATTTTGVAYHWELMIGGVTRAEWYTVNTTSEAVIGPMPPGPIPVSIPAGTQLQIQGECSGTAQAQEVAFHCFY